MWDPARYRQFGAERSRPFYELVGRIGAADPRFARTRLLPPSGSHTVDADRVVILTACARRESWEIVALARSMVIECSDR